MSHLKQGLAIVAGLIFVVGFKIGMRFVLADWSVENSRSSGWSADFRMGFLESCTDEATKSIADSMRLDLKDDSDKSAAKTIATEYCDCMASDVEKRKIFNTKFNQYRGLASAAADNEKVISNYMSSKEGKSAVDGCLEKAATD